MKKLVLFALGALACIAASSPRPMAKAQQSAGPTLAETTAFLKVHVNQRWAWASVDPQFGREGWFIEQSAFIIPGDNEPPERTCTVLFNRKNGRTDVDVKPVDEGSHLFDAKDLLLAEIKADSFQYPDGGPHLGIVTLHLSSNKKERIFIYSDNEVMAGRVANAFRGLAKLCGAKEEAY